MARPSHFLKQRESIDIPCLSSDQELHTESIFLYKNSAEGSQTARGDVNQKQQQTKKKKKKSGHETSAVRKWGGAMAHPRAPVFQSVTNLRRTWRIFKALKVRILLATY
jgi:hypothetical protein